MTLRLVGIGALGTMLAPSAKHLKDNQIVRYLRLLDRESISDIKEQRRRDWREYGVQWVTNVSDLIGNGDFDGVVICAGKNGDDQKIISSLIPLLNAVSLEGRQFFILHLSTVSCDFVKVTYEFCAAHHIHYVNYPLTGGSKGAQTAQMLILASGKKECYEKLKPMLELIGKPKYFNEAVTYAAAVKLIGHVMVFHGLLGISLAALLHKTVSGYEHFHSDQVEFFDFLNQGAGGTRQWDVALREGLRSADWESGFLIKYAVIDLLYTIQLFLEQRLPTFLMLPLLELALLFIFVLKRTGKTNLATQAIAAIIAETPSKEIDDFLKSHLSLDVQNCFQNCISLLPEVLKEILMLEVKY